jgi:hypothetical protein
MFFFRIAFCKLLYEDVMGKNFNRFLVVKNQEIVMLELQKKNNSKNYLEFFITMYFHVLINCFSYMMSYLGRYFRSVKKCKLFCALGT